MQSNRWLSILKVLIPLIAVVVLLIGFYGLIRLLLLAASTPTPTPLSPAETVTQSVTWMPTEIPTDIPPTTPPAVMVPSETLTHTATPSATATETPSHTATPSASAMPTDTPSHTATPSATATPTPTDTPSRTSTPSLTATQPPKLTSTRFVTATPAKLPSPTRRPTSTWTPPPGPSIWVAPSLLEPENGAVFYGREVPITLSWKDVQGMGPEEWYGVKMEFSSWDPESKAAVEWTDAHCVKAPLQTVPVHVFDKLIDLRTIRWSVVVVRKIEATPPPGYECKWDEIGQQSETRSIRWLPTSDPNPEAAPTRVDPAPTREPTSPKRFYN